MRFRSLYAQMDHADSGSEVSGILKQGEELRVRTPRSAKQMANFQFLQLVKKGKSRATFLGLKPYASKLADLAIGLGIAFVGGPEAGAVVSAAALTTRRAPRRDVPALPAGSKSPPLPDISKAIEMVETSPGVFAPAPA